MTTTPNDSLEPLLQIIERTWGFRQLRPLQEPAIRAVLNERDSLVVLPTGGGKSLCYQAPAVLREGTTVVVSPLISLMKDQVDTLKQLGVAATQIDSSQSVNDREAAIFDVSQGDAKLVFVSPERLVTPDFLNLMERIQIRTIAIDEAHCISHWGHDFRPEYRQLRSLRERFPQMTMHAYTATATEQVRQDIVAQLGLRDPEILVGNFDRDKLTYRVLPRQDRLKQVKDVLERHKDEAGIIYCLSRKDVDDLTEELREQGYHAMSYHAGMTSEERQTAQEAFALEQVDIVVATVAFGMGIDRSNVRFIIHVAMPKSLEHYQQETGRAGRDGLEAECVLLYSGKDVKTLKWMVEKSAEEAEGQVDPRFVASALNHIEDMSRYCRGAVCRHKALVEYFGQTYEKESCGSCDLCLGDVEEVADAVIVAQKILSCVARVQQRFGANHVVGVLRGEDTQNIRKWRHDKLTTYGLLDGHSKNEVRDWVEQLVHQKVLARDEGEYPVLVLNDASWEVMRGERTVRLVQMVKKKAERSQVSEEAWEGVDRKLFEKLRELRKELAQRAQVPPYVVFNDAVLRSLAQVRPSTLESMRLISGVGQKKLQDYGEAFLNVINGYCQAEGVSQDQRQSATTQTWNATTSRSSKAHDIAFPLFQRGASLDEVAEQMNRSRSTVAEYLAAFIRQEKPTSIGEWVEDETYHRVAEAARQVGTERLKPIFLKLGETVDYEKIRLVVAHVLMNQES